MQYNTFALRGSQSKYFAYAKSPTKQHKMRKRLIAKRLRKRALVIKNNTFNYLLATNQVLNRIHTFDRDEQKGRRGNAEMLTDLGQTIRSMINLHRSSMTKSFNDRENVFQLVRKRKIETEKNSTFQKLYFYAAYRFLDCRVGIYAISQKVSMYIYSKNKKQIKKNTS